MAIPASGCRCNWWQATSGGPAYSGRSSSDAYEAVIYNTAGTPYYYQARTTATVRTTTLSALARYTLTRQAARRLQFDVLGGLGVVHRSFYYRGSEARGYAGALQSEPFSRREADDNWLLTAGLATRYRLGARFEVNFDLATNRDLTYPDFIGSAALGVRYRFGQ